MTDDVCAYEIKPLSTETWDAFVALCDRHGGGGFGGCYCTWFHRATHSAPGTNPPKPAEYTRDYKRDLVENDDAHAALVFDGEEAVAWAQFGSPAELPNIRHRKQFYGQSSGCFSLRSSTLRSASNSTV